jgi:hypothetical protein
MDKQIQELIDGYLRNTLTEEKKDQLRRLVESSSRISDELKESEDAFRYLQHASYHSLKNKLKQYDVLHPVVKQTKINSGLTFSFLVLIFLCAVILMKTVYNAEALANEAYHKTGTSVLPENIESQRLWKAGQDSFTAKEYQQAWTYFQPFLDDSSNVMYEHAGWNVLLCRMAMDGVSKEWDRDLKLYIATSSGPTKINAQQLRSRIESLFGRMIYLHMPEDIPVLGRRML